MPEDKENPQNEGQGSRTAARACNEKTKQSVENADAEAKAEEAARALDGQEGDELRKTKEQGRSHVREEDPQIHRDK